MARIKEIKRWHVGGKYFVRLAFVNGVVKETTSFDTIEQANVKAAELRNEWYKDLIKDKIQISGFTSKPKFVSDEYKYLNGDDEIFDLEE